MINGYAFLVRIVGSRSQAVELTFELVMDLFASVWLTFVLTSNWKAAVRDSTLGLEPMEKSSRTEMREGDTTWEAEAEPSTVVEPMVG